MSHEHQGTIESTNRKNKNSSLAAFGFVAIVIILIVSAANYLRIQKPRFQPINYTERENLEGGAATQKAVEKQKADIQDQSTTTNRETKLGEKAINETNAAEGASGTKPDTSNE